MTTEEESCTREELQRATVGAFADGDTLGSAPDALNFALQAICAELVAQRIDVERVDSIGRLVAGLFGMHEHASICSPFEAEDLADLRDLHKGLYELGARLHHRIRRDLGWPTPGGTLEADEEAEAAYNAERKVVQARLDAAMASIQANLDKAAK